MAGRAFFFYDEKVGAKSKTVHEPQDYANRWTIVGQDMFCKASLKIYTG
jgi:hypothetical protein